MGQSLHALSGNRVVGLLSRSPAFAGLVAARGVSLVGDGVGTLALIVHVQRVRGSGSAVGLLLLVASLPRLLSPLAGAVADRVDRRTVIVAGELAQGLLVGAMALWLPPLPVLLVLLLGKALVVTIAEPAGQSALPALVEDADLPAANAMIGGLREAGEVLGPLLGGVLVAAAGVRAGLAVDALTFVISVPLLARIPALPPQHRHDDEPGKSLAADAWAGLRHVARDPVTRAVTAGFFFVGLTAADDVALPFLAPVLGAGERGIGVLYAGVGAGLVVGYLIRPLRRSIQPRAGFLMGMGIAALGNLLTAGAPFLAAAVAFQITRGVGVAILDVHLQTLIQRSVPRRLLGRVFANVYGAVNIAAAGALLLGGPLLDATSARTVLVTVGLVGLAGTALSALLLARARSMSPS